MLHESPEGNASLSSAVPMSSLRPVLTPGLFVCGGFFFFFSLKFSESPLCQQCTLVRVFFLVIMQDPLNWRFIFFNSGVFSWSIFLIISSPLFTSFSGYFNLVLALNGSIFFIFLLFFISCFYVLFFRSFKKFCFQPIEIFYFCDSFTSQKFFLILFDNSFFIALYSCFMDATFHFSENNNYSLAVFCSFSFLLSIIFLLDCFHHCFYVEGFP